MVVSKPASSDSSRYAQRGVSSGKAEVHTAIANLDKGIFPGAFCKILPDLRGGDPDYCEVTHMDGAGTKSSLAYLSWITGLSKDRQMLLTKEHLAVWKGIAWDSMVMNLDDLGCIGAMGTFLVSMSIGRNKFRIPGEVIATLIQECQDICDWLTSIGIPCYLGGGETADINDIVRTIVVDNNITTRMRRSEVIDASRICAPGFIVAFSSTGQAKWEKVPNSGMGSNGLTNARHDVLAPIYQQYPETYAPEMSSDLVYSGDFRLDDPLPGDKRFTIGSALLSPTRTYLPLIKELLAQVGVQQIMGLIHCSGGGQTKIAKFGAPDVMYRKDNLFPTPPLFQMLETARELPRHEMYQSYNMGHRLEAVVGTISVAEQCVSISKKLDIEARIIGEVLPASGTTRVQIIDENKKEFCYNKDGEYIKP